MNVALDVKDLEVTYQSAKGPVKGADGVSFTLGVGKRLGLVGESGSGKSTTALALMRLLKPPARISRGTVQLGELDLLAVPPQEFRKVRWSKIAMVPQGAMNSLNPVLRVKEQFFDTLRAHGLRGSNADLRKTVGSLLASVGLEPHVANLFPHELSGGMKQRVCIALAVCLEPKVIIADEPTSALDVVMQKQVMETLGEVQQRVGASVILITHDMAVVAQFADEVAVMYAGKIVEHGGVRDVFNNPLHPYTKHLVSSIPTLDSKEIPTPLPGSPPNLLSPPTGCRFHPRCPVAMPICKVEQPLSRTVVPGHDVECHLYGEDSDGE